MSWYVELHIGDGDYSRVEGPFPNAASAQIALDVRAKRNCMSSTAYRIVEQRDTVTIEAPKSLLPTDKQVRKEMPIARGVLGYFPLAIAAVANVSFVGNQQHNPGQPMHWARGKSTDHADCIVRHLIEAGTIDDDGLRHTAKLAWRALALLQEELEAANGK